MNNYQRFANLFASLSIIFLVTMFILLLRFANRIYAVFLFLGVISLLFALIFNNRAKKKKKKNDQNQGGEK